jgi:hypothetical protein
MSARLDPKDMREIIGAYQDACSAAIGRYDGFIAKFMGDGVLGGAFQLTPRGAQTLKGFEAPVLAWTVTGEVESISRFEASRSAGMTPFVGREHEVALLLEFLPGRGGNGSLRTEAGYWERSAGPLHEHKRAFHAYGGTMN